MGEAAVRKIGTEEERNGKSEKTRKVARKIDKYSKDEISNIIP